LTSLATIKKAVHSRDFVTVMKKFPYRIPHLCLVLQYLVRQFLQRTRSVPYYKGKCRSEWKVYSLSIQKNVQTFENKVAQYLNND